MHALQEWQRAGSAAKVGALGAPGLCAQHDGIELSVRYVNVYLILVLQPVLAFRQTERVCWGSVMKP